MTREEFLDKSKIVIFPNVYNPDNQADGLGVVQGVDDFIMNRDYLEFPIRFAQGYDAVENDKHHFVTSWYYNYALYPVMRYLNVNYDMNDFVMIENKREEGDFSFLLPRQLQYYHITGWRNTGSYLQSMEVNMTSNELSGTEDCPIYSEDEHEMCYFRGIFKFMHQCVHIENRFLDSDRTLVVSGDSMGIPFIPILARYYKHIYYLDNRVLNDQVSFFDFFHLEQLEIDDVDCAMFIWRGHHIRDFISKNLI